MRWLALAATIFVLTACDRPTDTKVLETPSPNPTATIGDKTRTPNRHQGIWRLRSGFAPEGRIAIEEDGRLWLEIHRRQIDGYAGCNSLVGPVFVTSSTFDASWIGSTEMGCGGNAMVIEGRFKAALDTVDTVERNGDRLILTGPGAELVFSWVPPAKPAPLVGTEWIIDGLGRPGLGVQHAPGASMMLDNDGVVTVDTGCRVFVGTWKRAQIGMIASDLSTQETCPSRGDQDRFIVSVLRQPFRADVDVRQLLITTVKGSRRLYGQAR